MTSDFTSLFSLLEFWIDFTRQEGRKICSFQKPFLLSPNTPIIPKISLSGEKQIISHQKNEIFPSQTRPSPPGETSQCFCCILRISQIKGAPSSANPAPFQATFCQEQLQSSQKPKKNHFAELTIPSCSVRKRSSTYRRKRR